MPKAQMDLSNQFLIAMPGMLDDTFAGSVIYLCEHNERGRAGAGDQQAHRAGLERPLRKGRSGAQARRPAGHAPVFFGGPVQTERGFVLHERLDAEGGHYNATLANPGRAGDDDQPRRARSTEPRCRAAQAARHPGLQRLGARGSSKRRSGATAG